MWELEMPMEYLVSLWYLATVHKLGVSICYDINMQHKQRWHDWTLHSKNLQVNKNNAEKIKRARFSLVKTENYGMYNSHSWVDVMQDELIT